MKTNIAIKILSLTLIAVMVCLCIVSCEAEDKAKDALNGIVDDVEGVIGDMTNPLAFEMQNSPQISLCAAELPPVYNDGANGSSPVLSQTLTATVLPESAPDSLKKVDWSVYWITNNTGNADATVLEYLTVTTTTDGGNVAVVKVYQGFEGSTIGIKATTRNGGHEAVCKATYEGKPSALEIYRVNGSNETIVNTSLVFDSGKTYQFRLNLTNIIGDVGSKFSTFEVVSYEEMGVVNGMMSERAVNGGTPYDKTYDLSDSACLLPNFVSYSIADGMLTLDVSSLVNHRFTASNAYGYYTSGIENCSFKITVKETLTGVTNVLNFTIRTVDEAVTVDNSTLVF